jgi:hypothetical protein
MLLNVLSLTPLLERFEAEYGTLTTLALFMGRKTPSAIQQKKGKLIVCSSFDYSGTVVYFYRKGCFEDEYYNYGCKVCFIMT